MTQNLAPDGRLAFVIGFCNGKGGPGKTTLALNSAVELFDQGRKVAFVDGEEGGINADALERFDPRIATRKARTAFDIDDAIQELSEEHDIILFDAPGQTSGEEVATICSVADLVVVPIKCSRKDVRGSQSHKVIPPTWAALRAGMNAFFLEDCANGCATAAANPQFA